MQELAEPKKPGLRKWHWLLIGLGVIVLVVIAFTVNGSSSEPEQASNIAELEAKQASKVSITYKVDTSQDWEEGDPRATRPAASITVEKPTGNSQSDVDLPLKNKQGDDGLTIDFDAGSFVYISAQKTQGYGTITCSIYADGTKISENSASGEYSIATCKGKAEQ